MQTIKMKQKNNANALYKYNMINNRPLYSCVVVDAPHQLHTQKGEFLYNIMT